MRAVSCHFGLHLIDNNKNNNSENVNKAS